MFSIHSWISAIPRSKYNSLIWNKIAQCPLCPIMPENADCKAFKQTIQNPCKEAYHQSLNPLSNRGVWISTTPSKNGIFTNRFVTFSEAILKIHSASKEAWKISFIWFIVCVFMANISWITTNFLKLVKTVKKRCYWKC